MEWLEDFMQQGIYSLVRFKNNFKQGTEKIFWNNGKLRSTKNWKNNKKRRIMYFIL